jgi:hypothetical protein
MELSMRRLAAAGFLILLWGCLLSGCASMKANPATARPDVAQDAVPPVAGPPSIPAPAASPSQPASSAGSSPSSAAGKEHPAGASASPPASAATSPSPAKTKPSIAAHPSKPAGAAAAQTRSPTAPTPPSSQPAPPTLDLADLEQRLRDTHAIGVFTKLSLKNQVDDLLEEFRVLYRGPNKRPPAELRQRYDLLLLKVLGLLQDTDPPLAAAISSSREAIWNILADPDKFAKI